MLSTDDTIAAISTPLGEGGIGIVRVSGKEAISIVERIFLSPKKKSLTDLPTYHVIFGYIVEPNTNNKIDEVLVTVMKNPYSYTREDVVEINCHGGMITLRNTLEIVLQQGVRLAEPGEFTKRAFLNGRIDLSQAEAVLDLIRSKTDESRRLAIEQLQGGLSQNITRLRDRLIEICAYVEAYIDFPEDDIEQVSKQNTADSLQEIGEELSILLKTYDEAKFFREGITTAIVGRPNVGKSSLLNALLKKDRVIVTDIPGTTRDVIEEYLNIKGLPLRLMDTAGIRVVDDITEKEGVRRSLESIENADLVIAIFDRSESFRQEDFEVLQKVKEKNTLYVLNKCDLPSAFNELIISSQVVSDNSRVLNISATRGDGLEELRESIFTSCLKNWKEGKEGVVVTNVRHKRALEDARASVKRTFVVMTKNQPLEILALELRDALEKLGEIVGIVTTEDILDKIFSDFCIGK